MIENDKLKDQHAVETFGPVESDPTGRLHNEPGAKLDAGKNRLGLVMCGFARALQEVGKVGTYGARKYSDNGWSQVPDGVQRYTDAMLRHLMSEATGEERDKDTDLLHAAHLAWNALARLDLMLRGGEYIDAGISERSVTIRMLDRIAGLESAINKTLNENGHLADGDNCTLAELKRVVGYDDAEYACMIDGHHAIKCVIDDGNAHCDFAVALTSSGLGKTSCRHWRPVDGDKE